MNRSDVVEAVANRSKMKVEEVEPIISTFLDVIGLSLACGEEVNIRNFGKFEPRPRKAVMRRNPKTGEQHQVPAKVSLGFVPSPNLKKRVNV